VPPFEVPESTAASPFRNFKSTGGARIHFANALPLPKFVGETAAKFDELRKRALAGRVFFRPTDLTIR
jgi:hypothetical protein